MKIRPRVWEKTSKKKKKNKEKETLQKQQGLPLETEDLNKQYNHYKVFRLKRKTLIIEKKKPKNNNKVFRWDGRP